jgi:hypothetical protein
VIFVKLKKFQDPEFEIEADHSGEQTTGSSSTLQQDRVQSTSSHKSFSSTITSFFRSRDSILLFFICLSDCWLLLHTIRAFFSFDAITMNQCFRRALWGCICSSVTTLFNNSLQVHCLCLLLCHTFQMFSSLTMSISFKASANFLHEIQSSKSQHFILILLFDFSSGKFHPKYPFFFQSFRWFLTFRW